MSKRPANPQNPSKSKKRKLDEYRPEPVDHRATQNYQDQLDEAQSEFLELVGKDKKRWVEKWIRKRYQVARAEALDLWKNFCGQQTEVQPEFRLTETQQIERFTEFMIQIWPKYLQAGLNELAADTKSSALQLAPEELADLPPSALTNLRDFRLFADFLRDDIKIETARYFKLQSCIHFGKTLAEKRYLKEYCIAEFLNEDEALSYNGLLEDFKPDDRWSEEHTSTYIEVSFDEWPQDLQLVRHKLQDFQEETADQKAPKAKPAPTSAQPTKP